MAFSMQSHNLANSTATEIAPLDPRNGFNSEISTRTALYVSLLVLTTSLIPKATSRISNSSAQISLQLSMQYGLLSKIKCWTPSLLSSADGSYLESPDGRLVYEHQPRRTPIHTIVCESNPRRSIVLAPLLRFVAPNTSERRDDPAVSIPAIPGPSGPYNPDQFQSTMVKKPVDDVGKNFQVLLAVRLEKDNLDVQAWVEWIRNAPAEAAGITIEGSYDSCSTLVLVRMPVFVWNLLPPNPAYSFVGFVTSRNTIQNDESSPAYSGVVIGNDFPKPEESSWYEHSVNEENTSTSTVPRQLESLTRTKAAITPRVLPTACENCYRRNVKCNRLFPCSNCIAAALKCGYNTPAEQDRHDPQEYFKNLEGHLTSLKRFVETLARGDTTMRQTVLDSFYKQHLQRQAVEVGSRPPTESGPPSSVPEQRPSLSRREPKSYSEMNPPVVITAEDHPHNTNWDDSGGSLPDVGLGDQEMDLFEVWHTDSLDNLWAPSHFDIAKYLSPPVLQQKKGRKGRHSISSVLKDKAGQAAAKYSGKR